MAFFEGRVVNKQILFKVLVAPLGMAEGREEAWAAMRPCKGLLDTGAQMTMISPIVAAEVGLASTGIQAILPANGQPFEVPKYRAGIGIPIGTAEESDIKGMELDIACLPYHPNGYDALIGMDFVAGLHKPSTTTDSSSGTNGREGLTSPTP